MTQRSTASSFLLYEGLLWEPPQGYFLLEEHLRRLERSAAHFRFCVSIGSLRERLSDFASALPQRPRKVRLEVSADGEIALEDEDLKPGTVARVALALEPVRSDDEFLRHKTSQRAVYDRALEARPEAEDVLLWNERGELTESCSANLVLEIAGRRLTPPVSSGLLPGIFREHLIERCEIAEEILPVKSVERADAIHLINSVRRWRGARLLRGRS